MRVTFDRIRESLRKLDADMDKSGRAFGWGQQMTSGLDVVGSNDTGEQAAMADAVEAARQL